jgi:hypothetical protein
MTEHTTTLDTAVAEPSPTAGEAGTLVFALDRSRATLAWKCGGLDAAGEATPDWPWTSAADDTPEELFRLWRAAGARCRAAVDAVLAEGGLDQQAKFDFPGNELPTARRLLVDLHDEYARHVGHADLLREAVDGLVGEDPPQG